MAVHKAQSAMAGVWEASSRKPAHHVWTCPAYSAEAQLFVGEVVMFLREPDAGKLHVRLSVQRRLACSAGDKPAGARVRSPVARIAERRETEFLKPIDDRLFGRRASHRAVMKVNVDVASKVRLERAKETTRYGKYTYVEYARFADDLVVLIDAHPRNAWMLGAVNKRLREEFAKLQVEINEEKSRIVDLERSESFGFLGFDFRRLRSIGRQVWRAHYTPKMKKRTALLHKLKEVFRRYQSQPVDRVVQLINPVLRGWVNYFAVGHSSECFSFIRDWAEKKIRRHMGRSRNRRGFGWKRWSRRWLYDELKLFNGYRVRRQSVPKALPA